METTVSKLASNKELVKNIGKLSHYTLEQFEKDAARYVSAIKEGRIICSIGSVSASGMSRTIKFLECRRYSDNNNRYNYLNFYCFFRALGYRESRKENYFTVNGCGMDMIFHTNYTNMHNLKYMGLISSEDCATLAQMTPSVI